MPDFRVLIADDEPPARQRLADLLAREPGVAVVGEAATGVDAVAQIRALAPDLVFLDVQMPGLTGLDVVREVGLAAMPAVVFVTAYDRHAVEAFDLAALDYLLKPYTAERFRQALARARERAAGRETAALRDHLAALIGTPPAAPEYATRLAVEARGQVRYVPVDAVDYLTSDGPYVEIHAAGETFVTRDRMQDVEGRLDPAAFARIHRSAVVRLDRVEALLVGRHGDYAVRLLDGTRLAVARGRRDALAERLEGRTG